MAAMMILMLVFFMASGSGGHMGSLGSHRSSEQTSHSHGRDAAKPEPEHAPHSHGHDVAKPSQEKP